MRLSIHRYLRGHVLARSDVEAFHKIIEDEFYDIEDYENLAEFMGKSYAYELYFNFKRKNRYKERKTPIEILKETGSNISSCVFNLPPIILDNFIDNFIEGSYHVGSSGVFLVAKNILSRVFF